MKKPNAPFILIWLFAGLISLLSNGLFAQFDSINTIVKKQTSTINKVDVLLKATTKFSKKPIALTFAKQAYQLALKNNNDTLIANSAMAIFNEYVANDNIDSVVVYQEIAIKYYKLSNHTNGLFNSLLKKFRFFKKNKKTDKAFEVYKELIDVAKKTENQKNTSLVNYNMGELFNDVNDYNKAIVYYNKAVTISIKAEDWEGVSNCYNALGNTYSDKKYFDFAIEYFDRALKISTKYNLKNEVHVLTGIGNVFYTLNNFEKALTYYKEAQRYNVINNDFNDISLKNNIGVSLMELQRYKEAKPYLIEVYFSKCSARDKADYAYNLSAIYQNTGDDKLAMWYMETYVRMNDSLNEIMYTINLSETEAKYRNEKQQEQNILLQERLTNKSRQMYFAIAGILLLAGLVFFIFRGLRQKQKANELLEEKNEIINIQKNIVEEQHQSISDSIKYAQRIQGAILPPKSFWQKLLPNSFVLYMPKDVLSGDFYWIEETDDFTFVAAADCTGHGVPGALISIVNYNLLNKAVKEKDLTNPAQILDAVNIWLTDSLHQTYKESTVKDGMDIALISINKHTNEVLFAGANNPIYILSNNNLTQVKGDKFPVGSFVGETLQKFTTKNVPIHKGDSIYLFSDGYADQFGGEKGKKYKYQTFQQQLITICNMPLIEQKQQLKHEFLNWKGSLEQVDDVLVIGVKIS